MKELGELIRDLQEDHDLLYKVGADYLLSADNSNHSDNTYLENVTVQDVNDVMCGIHELKLQNHKQLGRYLQYLKKIEEYEVSRSQSKR